MKKVLVTLLFCLITISFVGCGDKNTEESNVNSDGTEMTEEKNTTDTVISTDLTLQAVKEATETDVSCFEYEEVEGGIAITYYEGNDEIVVIPEMIDGKTVVAIGRKSFANDKSFKGLRLADTVTVVEKEAFLNCTSLEIVVCGNQLMTLGEVAFNNCAALKEVELSDVLKTMEFGCFGLTTSLREIYIPESVETISFAFDAGTDLTIITEAGSVAEQYANEKGFNCEIN